MTLAEPPVLILPDGGTMIVPRDADVLTALVLLGVVLVGGLFRAFLG